MILRCAEDEGAVCVSSGSIYVGMLVGWVEGGREYTIYFFFSRRRRSKGEECGGRKILTLVSSEEALVKLMESLVSSFF